MLGFDLVRGPRLETTRLILRRPVLADFRDWTVLRAASRDFLVPWEPSWPDDALSLAAFRRRLRQLGTEWRNDQGYGFFIFRRDGEQLLGGVNLSHLRRGVAQTASVGYWMGEAHANQGAMSEAMLALLPYAFDRLGLHRVEAACLPTNKPSRALLAKLGFREEGYAVRYLKINGSWQDHVLHSLLVEDFKRGPG